MLPSRTPGVPQTKRRTSPHSGEHALGSEETHISEEQIIPDKPAYEDAGQGSTDQGLKQPPPEQCGSLSDDSEIALVSDLGTPLEMTPHIASYLPHRGPHRNGKLQTSFESSRKDARLINLIGKQCIDQKTDLGDDQDEDMDGISRQKPIAVEPAESIHVEHEEMEEGKMEDSD